MRWTDRKSGQAMHRVCRFAMMLCLALGASALAKPLRRTDIADFDPFEIRGHLRLQE